MPRPFQQGHPLKRIKPGYYNPPGGQPIFVPGMQWLAIMVLGRPGPLALAAIGWWTTRGFLASHRREQAAGRNNFRAVTVAP